MNTLDQAIRVLIIDDQKMARVGIRQIVESESGIVVVGEGSDGADAVELVRSLRPHVVLMDIRMPRLDGVRATKAIVNDPSLEPKPAILMLTTFDTDDYIFGALESGAAGFLLKDVDPDDLVKAIRNVAAGDALVSPGVTRRLINAAVTQRRAVVQAGTSDPRYTLLSEREREVLLLVAEGLSNTQIAARLFVGETTVKSHVSSVLLKLQLENRVQAVVFAYENGLVVPGR